MTAADTASAAALVRETRAATLRPREPLTVSEWADRHRVLDGSTTPKPGKWRTDRTPYAREPMDRLGREDPCHTVVLMWGSQVAKSEIGLCWMGYVADFDPRPMMVVQPTIQTAERYSKKRIATTIAASPRLRELFGDPKSRTSGNAILEKSFPGGFLTITGANAPSGLSSDPIGALHLDEQDGHEGSAGVDGSPSALAIQRTAAFARRKILITSTPRLKETSKIEPAWKSSDRRWYFVPCPHCGVMQVLMWAGIRWERDDGEIVAHYVCGAGADAYDEQFPDSTIPGCDGPGCGALIANHEKLGMLARGEWRATAVSKDPGVHGYRLSALYAQHGLGWTWSQIANQFLEAKDTPEELKVWTNTRLAESWQEIPGKAMDPTGLMNRLEPYGDGRARRASGKTPIVPDGVGVITAGVDVQANRIEVSFWGWGLHDESWLLDHIVLWGDPDDPALLEELEDLLRERWETASGATVDLVSAGIDCGYRAEVIYEFVRAHRREKWLGIIGRSGRRPLWAHSTDKAKVKAKAYKPFVVGIDAAKEAIYSRLERTEPGPGYIHLPTTLERAHVEQLVAETKMVTKSKGHPVVSWYLPNGARNEVLDCAVYAMAVFVGWSRGAKSVAVTLARRAESVPSPPQKPPQPATAEPDGDAWIPDRDWFR